MDADTIRATGWEEIPDLTPDLARLYGMPDATKAYRKLVSDGSLVAVVGRSDNGYAFALTHVAYFDATRVIPGRYPTWVDVYAARRVLIPNETILMVAVLEPMTYALRLRWERAQSLDRMPPAPGLPTTVKCVQMYCEGVTEDCVFGTEDVPTPTPVPVTSFGLPPDPVGPVPHELLGDAEEAALDEEFTDDDPGVD